MFLKESANMYKSKIVKLKSQNSSDNICRNLDHPNIHSRENMIQKNYIKKRNKKVAKKTDSLNHNIKYHGFPNHNERGYKGYDSFGVFSYDNIDNLNEKEIGLYVPNSNKSKQIDSNVDLSKEPNYCKENCYDKKSENPLNNDIYNSNLKNSSISCKQDEVQDFNEKTSYKFHNKNRFRVRITAHSKALKHKNYSYRRNKIYNSPESFISDTSNDQTLLGLVALADRVEIGVVRRVTEFLEAGIKFVVFNEGSYRQTKNLGTKLGLETDWNTLISLSTESNHNQTNIMGNIVLPCGITEIRRHLIDTDTVPLQLPLFCNATSQSIKEMLSIYKEYGDRVCAVGSNNLMGLPEEGMLCLADAAITIGVYNLSNPEANNKKIKNKNLNLEMYIENENSIYSTDNNKPSQSELNIKDKQQYLNNPNEKSSRLNDVNQINFRNDKYIQMNAILSGILTNVSKIVRAEDPTRVVIESLYSACEIARLSEDGAERALEHGICFTGALLISGCTDCFYLIPIVMFSVRMLDSPEELMNRLYVKPDLESNRGRQNIVRGVFIIHLLWIQILYIWSNLHKTWLNNSDAYISVNNNSFEDINRILNINQKYDIISNVNNKYPEDSNKYLMSNNRQYSIIWKKRDLYKKHLLFQNNYKKKQILLPSLKNFKIFNDNSNLYTNKFRENVSKEQVERIKLIKSSNIRLKWSDIDKYNKLIKLINTDNILLWILRASELHDDPRKYIQDNNIKNNVIIETITNFSSLYNTLLVQILKFREIIPNFFTNAIISKTIPNSTLICPPKMIQWIVTPSTNNSINTIST